MSAKDVAERLRKLRKAEILETPEGQLFVRGLSGTERHEYMQAFTAIKGVDRLKADQHLVALALCGDSKGSPVFDAFDEAMGVVLDWPIDVVTAGAKIICRLSGLASDSETEAEKK